jgi:hypothetical protein
VRHEIQVSLYNNKCAFGKYLPHFFLQGESSATSLCAAESSATNLCAAESSPTNLERRVKELEAALNDREVACSALQAQVTTVHKKSKEQGDLNERIELLEDAVKTKDKDLQANVKLLQQKINDFKKQATKYKKVVEKLKEANVDVKNKASEINTLKATIKSMENSAGASSTTTVKKARAPKAQPKPSSRVQTNDTLGEPTDVADDVCSDQPIQEQLGHPSESLPSEANRLTDAYGENQPITDAYGGTQPSWPTNTSGAQAGPPTGAYGGTQPSWPTNTSGAQAGPPSGAYGGTQPSWPTNTSGAQAGPPTGNTTGGSTALPPVGSSPENFLSSYPMFVSYMSQYNSRRKRDRESEDDSSTASSSGEGSSSDRKKSRKEKRHHTKKNKKNKVTNSTLYYRNTLIVVI